MSSDLFCPECRSSRVYREKEEIKRDLDPPVHIREMRCGRCGYTWNFVQAKG